MNTSKISFGAINVSQLEGLNAGDKIISEKTGALTIASKPYRKGDINDPNGDFSVDLFAADCFVVPVQGKEAITYQVIELGKNGVNEEFSILA